MKLKSNIFLRINSVLEEKNINEIFKGSTYALILRISGFFLSFIVSIIVVKYYGAEALGLLAILLSILNISSVLALFGFRTATVRQIARYANYGRSILLNIYKKTGSLVIAFSLLLGTIMYLNSTWIATQIFGKEELTLVIKIVSIILPFHSMNAVNIASLRGLKKIIAASSLQFIFHPFLNLIVLAILFSAFSYNIVIPVYANALTTVILILLTSLFTFIHFRKIHESDIKQTQGIIATHFSYTSLLSLSLPMLFSASMLLLLGAIDTIFLGIFSTTHNTGVYKVALKLVVPINFMLTAIKGISGPKFAELYHQNKFSELKHTAQFSSKISFLFTLPIVLILILVAKPVLSFLGTSFQAGYVPFLILISGRLVSAYCGPNKSFLNMTNNHKTLGKMLLITVILNILLNFALVPPYGIIGAAIATSLSIISLNIFISVAIYKKFGYWINYLPKYHEKAVK